MGLHRQEHDIAMAGHVARRITNLSFREQFRESLARGGRRIDLHQRFIRMVDKGPLRVTAEVFHPGRKVMQIRGEAYESRGKLAATATGSFIILPPGT